MINKGLGRSASCWHRAKAAAVEARLREVAAAEGAPELPAAGDAVEQARGQVIGEGESGAEAVIQVQADGQVVEAIVPVEQAGVLEQ